jgi:hypothetical protein
VDIGKLLNDRLARVGETIVAAYGRNQEKLAALIPYDQLPAHESRQLGLLVGQVSSFACRTRSLFFVHSSGEKGGPFLEAKNFMTWTMSIRFSEV